MVWAICALLCAGVALTAGSQDYLLPGDIKPLHYDVRVIYDIDPTTNFTLYGCVDILLTPIKTTSKIVLHIDSLTIPDDGISLSGPTVDLLKVNGFKVNDTFNFLTVDLGAELQPGINYTLSIPFLGNLSNGLDGVYISSYVEGNVTEYLIATQFEAISARKGFPCFDEPMYKATFSISIGHSREFNAVSNMPLHNSTDENLLEDPWSWYEIEKTFKKNKSLFVWDTFQKSVPMSTYLVAFVISKFSYVESPPGLSTTAFKIWARMDAIDQTSYAASIGPQVLSHFEQFFNVSFPLPKQDMIAIPDFSAGAMENWGLITYRETALLYDKAQSSFINKERVAEVIAHELAHQWFGNLVTMKWWSDLWLNEGFATFVASIGVNAVEHTWNADRNYAVDNILSVLNLDSLESSHPVSTKLEHPKRINEIFDEISYRKGAALIRMMTLFLGQDVFRRALHNYLVKYSYSNAEQDDLWSELTATSQEYGGLTRNVSVKEVMDTWTTQTGYPLLTVSRDYSDNTLTVTQKRYLNIAAKSTTCVSWWVPLSVMCESEAGQPIEPVQWLANTEGVANKHRFEHSANTNEWVLFNYDMIAPYRVNYDARNWQLLIKTLTSSRFTAIPVLGRVQLLSDAFALAWSEQLDYSIALDLSNYLQRETEYLPLSTGMRALGKIENVLKRTAEYGAFQKFLRQIIGEQYLQAGGLSQKTIINGDDLNSVKMQVMTSSWACKAKVPGCEENAIELFRQWMDEPEPDKNNPIPLDLRSTVYCVAIKRGSVREWRFMLERKRRANVAGARETALSALTCTSEVWILTQYLEWAITDNTDIRRQDSGRVIAGVTGSTVGYYVAKDFIYTRIKDIYGAFHGQGRRIGIIIKTLLMQFTTQRELDEFLAWREINKKYLEEAELAVLQGIEAAKVNIAWLNRNKKLVTDKFREYSSLSAKIHVPEPTQKTLWKGFHPGYLHSILAVHNISATSNNGLLNNEFDLWAASDVN